MLGAPQSLRVQFMLMKTRANRSRLMLAIAIALSGIVVPYFIAWRISPAGTVFSGFLFNPLDGFTYLAKMRQGYEGSWLFQLPYTAEPGQGVLLFIFYLALGQLNRLLDLPLITTFHAARVLISTGFFVLLYIFYDQIFEDRRLKWAGFLFSLFGSGLGWLALLVLGRQTIDLLVPEAIPFLSAYTNPHFPLAACAFIGGILLVYKQGRRNTGQMVLALACGFVLGAVLPFSTIPLFLVLGLWSLWELAIKRAWPGKEYLLAEAGSLMLLFLGALPWLLYDYCLSMNHPVIAAWNAQNLTPSPPLIETVLGFGLMFAGALASLIWKPWKIGRAGRLLTVWFVVGFILLYIPLPFQRRLSMGLFLPMAGLTAWAMSRLVSSTPAFRLAQTVILSFSAPSILLVMVAGLSAAGRGDGTITYSADELAAYEWIQMGVEPGSLVLADPRHGNRLPAFAPVSVLYGHPFETPNADFWRTEVLELLEWSGNEDAGLDLLDQYRVDWVMIQVNDLSGAPTWLDELTPVERFDGLWLMRIDQR